MDVLPSGIWSSGNRNQPVSPSTLPIAEQKRTQAPVARLPTDGLASSSALKERMFADELLVFGNKAKEAL